MYYSLPRYLDSLQSLLSIRTSRYIHCKYKLLSLRSDHHSASIQASHTSSTVNNPQCLTTTTTAKAAGTVVVEEEAVVTAKEVNIEARARGVTADVGRMMATAAEA